MKDTKTAGLQLTPPKMFDDTQDFNTHVEELSKEMFDDTPETHDQWMRDQEEAFLEEPCN